MNNTLEGIRTDHLTCAHLKDRAAFIVSLLLNDCFRGIDLLNLLIEEDDDTLIEEDDAMLRQYLHNFQTHNVRRTGPVKTEQAALALSGFVFRGGNTPNKALGRKASRRQRRKWINRAENTISKHIDHCCDDCKTQEEEEKCILKELAALNAFFSLAKLCFVKNLPSELSASLFEKIIDNVSPDEREVLKRTYIETKKGEYRLNAQGLNNRLRTEIQILLYRAKSR